MSQIVERSRRCSETFQRIGARVERAWARFDCDDALLPRIAAEALAEAEPHRATSGDDIIAWAVTCPQLGAQPNADSAFGQPPITVWAGRRFFIEALHWFDGTTSIHQHSFSGAFAVLDGGSIHTTYDFDTTTQFSPRFRTGHLRFQEAELLAPGDTRMIPAGSALIHALFHLQRPSVSIVVRNVSTVDAGTQLEYMAPHVATDPFDQPVWGKRAESYLRGLIGKQSEYVDEFIAAMFAELDLRWAFRLYEQFSRPDLAGALAIGERYAGQVRARLEAAARDRFGAQFPAVAATAQRAHEVTELIGLRSRIRTADERFFLALLLNVPDRERLLALVAQRFGDPRPEARVAAWVRALLRDSARTGVEFEDDALELVDSVLAGESTGPAIARLERKHGPLDAGERDAVAAALVRVRRSPLLRPFAAEHEPESRPHRKLDGVAIDEVKEASTV